MQHAKGLFLINSIYLQLVLLLSQFFSLQLHLPPLILNTHTHTTLLQYLNISDTTVTQT